MGRALWRCVWLAKAVFLMCQRFLGHTNEGTHMIFSLWISIQGTNLRDDMMGGHLLDILCQILQAMSDIC